MCTTAWVRGGRHPRCGPCTVGVESTILAPGPEGTRLLREGGIPREAIEAITGPLIADLTPGRVEAPGQMERHYAPRVPLRLGGDARGPERLPSASGTGNGDLSLSETGDLSEAALRLFSVLHAAEALALERGAPRSARRCFPTGALDARSTTGSGARRPRSERRGRSAQAWPASDDSISGLIPRDRKAASHFPSMWDPKTRSGAASAVNQPFAAISSSS
jgi:hypothetical protein